MKVIILTGSEMRHEYFRKKIASDNRIEVLASFCEGTEKSLENRLPERQTHEKSSSEALRGPSGGPSGARGIFDFLGATFC